MMDDGEKKPEMEPGVPSSITHSPSPDPLHGVTLAMILERLHAEYGWEGLARRVPVRCFQLNPSIQSSLKFLRKTPWARAKVEALYLELKSI